MKYNYHLLDTNWYKKHQQLLLILLNLPIVGRLLRWYCKFPIKYNIVAIMPSSIYSHEIEDKYRFLVYSGNGISKNIAYRFSWIFLFVHYLDKLVDPILPELSFGFNTFTKVPQTGGGSNNATCDGYILNKAFGAGFSWDIMRSINPHDNVSMVPFHSNETLNAVVNTGLEEIGKIVTISRGLMSFDFMALQGKIEVTDAYLHLRTHPYTGTSKYFNEDNINFCKWKPLSKPGHTTPYGDIIPREETSTSGEWIGDWNGSIGDIHNTGYISIPVLEIDAPSAFREPPVDLQATSTAFMTYVEDSAGGILGLGMVLRADNYGDPHYIGGNYPNWDTGQYITYSVFAIDNTADQPGPYMTGAFILLDPPNQIIMIV